LYRLTSATNVPICPSVAHEQRAKKSKLSNGEAETSHHQSSPQVTVSSSLNLAWNLKIQNLAVSTRHLNFASPFQFNGDTNNVQRLL
jgi:hypothetical protein